MASTGKLDTRVGLQRIGQCALKWNRASAVQAQLAIAGSDVREAIVDDDFVHRPGQLFDRRSGNGWARIAAFAVFVSNGDRGRAHKRQRCRGGENDKP